MTRPGPTVQGSSGLLASVTCVPAVNHAGALETGQHLLREGRVGHRGQLLQLERAGAIRELSGCGSQGKEEEGVHGQPSAGGALCGSRHMKYISGPPFVSAARLTSANPRER